MAPSLSGAAALLAALSLTACSSPVVGGKKGFHTANDDLRLRVLTLENENAILKLQRDELTAKLAEEQRVREGLVTADVLAAIPRCVGVELDSFSGFDPADPKLPVKGFILYLAPYDGQRRFVQIVGTVHAEVLELADTAGVQQPRTIAAATLTPGQLRDAYRSGFTGTHYEISLGTKGDLDADLRSRPLLLRLQFNDAITGQIHEAQLNVGARNLPATAK